MDARSLDEKFTLTATLSAEINPASPVIMGGNYKENIGRASRLGYRAVELHWANPLEIPLDEISSICDAYDMKISAFATGRAYVQEGLSLIDDDDSVRCAALQRLLAHVDAASRFHAAVIIGCIRGNIPAGSANATYMERFAAAAHTIAGYAAKRNVSIFLEAINRYENNYLNTAKETADFIRKYELPNTKILLDTFHMNIEEADPPGAVIECGDLLGYVHVADSTRRYAGAGHIDFQSIASALESIHYQGHLSAECLPLPDSQTALENWIKGIKTYFI